MLLYKYLGRKMKTLILLCCVIMAGCTHMPSTDSPPIQQKSLESILLSSYLGNRHPAYTKSGTIDELAQFKQLERFYIQLVEPKKWIYTRDNLALIFFFSTYAAQVNNAAFNEYLSTDLKIIVDKEPELFAKTLSELSFSVKPVCDRLGADGESSDGATPSRNTLQGIIMTVFEKSLNDQDFATCKTSFSN